MLEDVCAMTLVPMLDRLASLSLDVVSCDESTTLITGVVEEETNRGFEGDFMTDSLRTTWLSLSTAALSFSALELEFSGKLVLLLVSLLSAGFTTSALF